MKRNFIIASILLVAFNDTKTGQRIEYHENSFKATSGRDYNFEIRNKSKENIILEIQSVVGDMKTLVSNISLSAMKGSKEQDASVFRAKISPIQDPFDIVIKKASGDVLAAYLITARKGKTAFLTFENNALRPQKGSFGKTQSGLSTGDNITSSGIKKESAADFTSKPADKLVGKPAGELMIAGPTHYQILGVKKESTTEDVNKAFRGLSKKEHPDKGGNVESYKKIVEARDVLVNPANRRAYDDNLKKNDRWKIADERVTKAIQEKTPAGKPTIPPAPTHMPTPVKEQQLRDAMKKHGKTPTTPELTGFEDQTQQGQSTGDKSQLLKDIEAGKTLRKVETQERSKSKSDLEKSLEARRAAMTGEDDGDEK